jgi:hypothetical protein
MPAATLSTPARLVQRVSSALAGRTSRRGFLARSAVAGTALSVAPTDLLLRPTTAYAAICGCSGSNCDCGDLCCDGYTEFCCTLTGVNACPSGTALGGWWKADGSSYCGNGPRYYMDCNVLPGANPCSCGCAQGSCANRKACCTHFRYGQCHQEIPSMGAIMCRVVSCTPPWVLDGTCTTATATDQNTLFHDRSCLESSTGSFDVVQRIDPGHLRVAGWAIDGETNEPIDVHVYVDGSGAAITTANLSRSDLGALYPTYGPNHGFDVTFPISASAASVCVYAISRGAGVNTQLGCKPIPHDPIGSLDLVAPVPGGARVAGWALDVDTTGPIAVHVYVDGAFAAAVPTGLNRPDVAARYGYGAGHGFDTVISPLAPGTHNVCAYAINQGAGTANPPIGCGTVTLGGNPFGSVDLIRPVVGGIRVAGWAVDLDTYDPVTLHFYVDGAFAAAGIAGASRPDVAARYGYGSAHGFDTTVKTTPGAHSICVYAINVGSGSSNPPLGCGSVNVG